MRYREFKPSPALDRQVQCYWVLEGEAGAAAQPVFPDGHPEVVFHFGDPFWRVTASGAEQQGRALAVGQMLKPAILLPSGVVGVFGVRFRPAGFAAIMRQPAHEFANRIVPLDGRLGAVLGEVVPEEALSWPEKIRRIETFLQSGLRGADVAVGGAVAILESRPEASMDDLSHAIGLSSRQLRRRFLEEAGIGPTTFARIQRFQRALRGLDSASGAAVAAESGYYDQAHMIADFREFAGSTPIAVKLAPALTAVFVR